MVLLVLLRSLGSETIQYVAACASIPGKPIFSVDIHPDGTKFATGGQGMSDKRLNLGL